MFKRQVAAMEVSPTMLGRPAMELRESILRGGPDVAPASSYEELPAAQVTIKMHKAVTCLLAASLLPVPKSLKTHVLHLPHLRSTATGQTLCCWTRQDCKLPL